jgi:hypothetical protein
VLFHLILRSVAKRSVSKDGNAKDGAAAIMRCIGIALVATRRDTPLRSVPQGEVGVQPVSERFTRSQDDKDGRWRPDRRSTTHAQRIKAKELAELGAAAYLKDETAIAD